MKKLLVLALAAIMVLSVAAVSMAAVTVGGEVNFGWNMYEVEQANGGTLKDFADAKVTATAALNDEVTAFVAIKSDSFATNKTFVDEATIKFTEGFGTVKVGYFGYNIKGNLDILGGILGFTTGDLKGNTGINLAANVAEGVTFNAYINDRADTDDVIVDFSKYGLPKVTLPAIEVGPQYAFGIGYATDAFGGDVNIAQNLPSDLADALDAGTALSLNAFYNITPAKVYLHYGTQSFGDSDFHTTVVGVLFDTDTVYGRFEYDVNPPENAENAFGIRLGYKLSSGVKIEYNNLLSDYVKDLGNSSIKINCAF